MGMIDHLFPMFSGMVNHQLTVQSNRINMQNIIVIRWMNGIFNRL